MCARQGNVLAEFLRMLSIVEQLIMSKLSRAMFILIAEGQEWRIAYFRTEYQYLHTEQVQMDKLQININ